MRQRWLVGVSEFTHRLQPERTPYRWTARAASPRSVQVGEGRRQASKLQHTTLNAHQQQHALAARLLHQPPPPSPLSFSSDIHTCTSHPALDLASKPRPWRLSGRELEICAGPHCRRLATWSGTSRAAKAQSTVHASWTWSYTAPRAVASTLSATLKLKPENVLAAYNRHVNKYPHPPSSHCVQRLHCDIDHLNASQPLIIGYS